MEHCLLHLLLSAVLTFSTKINEGSATKVLCDDVQENWDYVNVRPNAYMFWWAYCSAEKIKNPLVLWLQGGPGGSSTGFGNFEEIGPLNVHLQPRNTTWLHEANLLFIDNPVGTGFSYTTSDDAFTTNVWQIADDLLLVMKSFLKKNPNFQKVPFYIFSESYGGKMTAAFSKILYKAIRVGDISCNFKGLAMGDSWISPIDSVLTWAPYLYATSLIDKEGYMKINQVAQATKTAVEAGLYKNATNLWQKTEDVIANVTNGVDFYNILKWDNEDESLKKHQNSLTDLEKIVQRHVKVYEKDSLSMLMNGPIRKKLQIIPSNVTWGAQSGKVFEKQSGDFMKPVINVVDSLLLLDLKVVVYSGQLDLIVDTMGTEQWVQKLKWSSLPEFNGAKRMAVIDEKTKKTLAYVKTCKNFSFFWIMNAGHMVPSDNGLAAIQMLKMIV